MDTTQKTREEAARRSPRQEAPKTASRPPQGAKKPRPAGAEPAKRRPAQSGSGEARKAGEQRSGAQQRPKQAAPKQRREAPKQKAPLKQKQTPPRQKRPARQADPDDISNKKRVYGKTKPKKKSAIAALADTVKQSAAKSAAKKAKKKSSHPKQPTPAVIYTQPQAFNRNRLLVQLITVTAIVVALVMGLSVFFKVEHITVSGANVYSEWSVREACGIDEGDNLLTFSHARAAALIKANLPYVNTVRFGIKLPDTVNIIIDEADVVYAIKSNNGDWWLMNSNGRVVEQGNNAKASSHTQVLGVTLDNPAPDEKGIATEATPVETEEGGEVVPVTTTGAQRLTAALQILKALEENDIVGSAASVDVSRIDDIILWYGTRYQVNLGDSSRLDYKIACMNDVILQMSDYQSGILDISFTIWPTQVGYTPFS